MSRKMDSRGEQVIFEVANGRADAGAIAKFRLELARENLHPRINLVEPIPGVEVDIPNGAYLLSPAMSVNREAIDEIRSQLLIASRAVDADGPFGLATLSADDNRRLREHYLAANPRDRSQLILVLVASALIVVAGGLFLRLYRPTA